MKPQGMETYITCSRKVRVTTLDQLRVMIAEFEQEFGVSPTEIAMHHSTLAYMKAMGGALGLFTYQHDMFKGQSEERFAGVPIKPYGGAPELLVVELRTCERSRDVRSAHCAHEQG